jgi:hypothetical protein
MPSYEFQRKNSGRLESAAHYLFPEDDAALLFASRIVPSDGVTIEVWEGTRFVCRAESDGVISTASPITENKVPKPSA